MRRRSRFCRKSTAGVSAQPALARLNEEIRRRERVIRIFPNRESAKRLIGALLMKIDEKWASGRKYLDMDGYLEWRKSQAVNKNNKITSIG